MPIRRVRSPEAAALFVQIREAKGWNTNQAATIAKRKGIKGLGQSMLWSLETGRITMPTPKTLRAMAKLYEVEYAPLAQQVAALVYQTERSVNKSDRPDLSGQTSGLDSPSTHESTDGRQNSSVSSDERARALETALRTVLATTIPLLDRGTVLELIADAAGAQFIDADRRAMGVRGANPAASGESLRHRGPRPKRTGTRR